MQPMFYYYQPDSDSRHSHLDRIRITLDLQQLSLANLQRWVEIFQFQQQALPSVVIATSAWAQELQMTFQCYRAWG